MNPLILIGITTAHGVALDGSRGATPLELAEQAAWFRPGSGDQNGQMRWGGARSSPSTQRPKWTLAEAAVAAGGLDERFHLALRYSFARDDSAVTRLQAALWGFVKSRQAIERWFERLEPRADERKSYAEDLVDLCLLEERHPARFSAPGEGSVGRPKNLRPILMGVNADIWRRKLSRPYEAVRAEYQSWLAVGIAHMRRRLVEND